MRLHATVYTTLMLWCMQVTDSYSQVSACSVRDYMRIRAFECICALAEFIITYIQVGMPTIMNIFKCQKSGLAKTGPAGAAPTPMNEDRAVTIPDQRQTSLRKVMLCGCITPKKYPPNSLADPLL